MTDIVTGSAPRSTGSTGSTGSKTDHNAGSFHSINRHNGQDKKKNTSARTGIAPGTPGTPGEEPPTAPARWVRSLLHALGAQKTGKKWQCPAHGLTGEHTVSLSVETGDDGRCLLYCHGGCSWRDVCRALKITPGALIVQPPTLPEHHARAYLAKVTFPPPKAVEGGSPVERGFRFESEHPYGDDVWLVRLRHRSGQKEVTWESHNHRGERVPGLLGRKTRDLPLYYEREVRQAIGADEPVILVESESSADALRRAGLYSTTWAGGAGSPNTTRLAKVLLASDDGGTRAPYPRLVVIPDVDEAGITCLRKLDAAGLVPHLMHGEQGEDARDLLERVGPEAFRTLITEALDDS